MGRPGLDFEHVAAGPERESRSGAGFRRGAYRSTVETAPETAFSAIPTDASVSSESDAASRRRRGSGHGREPRRGTLRDCRARSGRYIGQPLA
jgi:hypothetical protein